MDGTVLLVWQSPSLGADFPSDGYVWAPNEAAFQLDVSGYVCCYSSDPYTVLSFCLCSKTYVFQVLEMYIQKIGFAPGETVATHTRRRYRLHPSRNPNHQGPNPDPCLWIVHYSQADPADRVPSNVIPIDMRISQTISVRQHLQSQGQIVQKDFMLHDRNNWPSIAFPRGRPQGQQPMYGGTVPPARVPQTMAYPPQQSQQGPPAKRARPNASANASAVNNPAALIEVDDEEDTSRGDLFDHVTPREISVARYKQNHEWMEEILSSPYSMNQIEPADLGLGMRGALSNLTAEIFDAPFDPDKDTSTLSYVGRLDPGKADQFRQRTSERVAKENKEIERLKAKHAKRMAKFRKGNVLSLAEKELRTAVNNPDDTGPEFWRLEGRIDDEEKEDDMAVKATPARVSDIVAKVEASVGRHARQVEELVRIQTGGFEEAPLAPSPQAIAVPAQGTPAGSHNGSNHSGVMIGDADMDMGNSAAGLLDQFHTGLSSHAPTPGSTNFPTPQAHLHSAVGTPGVNSASPASSNHLQQPLPQSTQNQQPQGQEGDWVVVPPGGHSPPSHNPNSNPNTNLNTAAQPSTSTSTPIPDFHTSPNDFADLGDLETGGGYGDELDVGGFGGHDDGDEGMGEDMDESAFGDAFHASGGGEGGDEEDGL